MLDAIWLGHERGVAPAEVAAALEVTVEQVERVVRDIESKRRATDYLRAPSLNLLGSRRTRHDARRPMELAGFAILTVVLNEAFQLTPPEAASRPATGGLPYLVVSTSPHNGAHRGFSGHSGGYVTEPVAALESPTYAGRSSNALLDLLRLAFFFITGFFLAFSSRGAQGQINWKIIRARLIDLIVPYYFIWLRWSIWSTNPLAN